MAEQESTAPDEGAAIPRRAAPTRLQRAAKWYGNVSDILTPERIGLLLGAALLLVVGIVGGWGAAEEEVGDLTTLEVGIPAEIAPFGITVHRARYFDELPPAFYAEHGHRYIAVSVDVEGTSERFVSAGILAQAASLEVEGLRTVDYGNGPQTLSPQVVRTSDSLAQRTVQPGLPTNVVLVWLQETSQEIPEEVTLTFSQHTWRRSIMDDSMGWRDPDPSAVLTLPLEPLPEG